MGFFSELKDKMRRSEALEDDFMQGSKEEYLELSTDEEIDSTKKVSVRPFTLEDFEDIRHVIDALRTGNVIAMINIRPLKEKEITELKRAVAKLRKTTDALGGDIAGFTEDIVIATGSTANIHKTKSVHQVQE